MMNNLGRFSIYLLTCILAGCQGMPVEQRTQFYIPKQIKTIYVVGSTHVDLGFYDTIEGAKQMSRRTMDEALSYAEKDPDFVWLIEDYWMVQDWFDHEKDPEKRKRMLDAIARGQLPVSADWEDQHTGFMFNEALNRQFMPAQKFARENNLTLETAVSVDTSDHAWGLPQAMAKSGVRYYWMNRNGGFNPVKLDKAKHLFWWEGPDGSRVLTWISLMGYAESIHHFLLSPKKARKYWAHHKIHEEDAKLSDMQLAQKFIGQRLKELEDGGYPYDAILISHSSDNNVMSISEIMDLLTRIREWNKLQQVPKLILARPQDFFKYVEQKYGDKIQTVRGDWTGHWSGVKAFSPYQTGRLRWAQDHLPVVETLGSILTRFGEKVSKEQINSAWERLFDCASHGFQAVPTDENVSHEKQLKLLAETMAMARASYEPVEKILETQLARLANLVAKEAGILVYNPLGYRRTDIVRWQLPKDMTKTPGLLVDASSRKTILCQFDKKEISFVAEDIPPIGYRLYKWHTVSDIPANVVSKKESMLENSFYRIRIDQYGDIVELRDKSTDKDLADSQGAWKINQGLWAKNRASFFKEYKPLEYGKVDIEAFKGPVFDLLVITRPDSIFDRTEIRLIHILKKIEITNRLNYSKAGIIPYEDHSHHYFFAFPFALEQRNSKARWDGANVILSQVNDFPGAVFWEDRVSDHFIDLSDGQKGVTIAHRQSFLGHRSGNVYLSLAAKLVSQVRNTDGKIYTYQEYEETKTPYRSFDYALTLTKGEFNPVSALRFGHDLNVPLQCKLVTPSDGPLKDPVASFFSVDSENVQIVNIKPASFGSTKDVIIRIQEVSGKQVDTILRSLFPVKQVAATNLLEESTDRPMSNQGNSFSFSIKPYETITLRITPE